MQTAMFSVLLRAAALYACFISLPGQIQNIYYGWTTLGGIVAIVLFAGVTISLALLALHAVRVSEYLLGAPLDPGVRPFLIQWLRWSEVTVATWVLIAMGLPRLFESVYALWAMGREGHTPLAYVFAEAFLLVAGPWALLQLPLPAIAGRHA